MKSEIWIQKTRMLLIACMVFPFFIACRHEMPSRTGADLESGFLKPPASASPRVWWHWMNGNVTKEGIRADLEWMHRIGIGGFQNFDAGLATPQIVEKRLVYMTPQWKDAFLYATRLADSLGLEMAIAGSPGWSESGGPWVPPSQAMKKLVWSETRVRGGNPFAGKLRKPPSTSGMFQNLQRGRRFFIEAEEISLPEYYADAAVIAFRSPEADMPMSGLKPKISSSGGQFDLVTLTDGDLARTVHLPAAPVGEKAWIQFEFEKPETFYSLSIADRSLGRMFGMNRDADNRALEASDDGKIFRTIVNIPGSRLGHQTITFAPVTAKYFRFTFRTDPPPPGPEGMAGSGGGPGQAVPAGIQIAELVLYSGPRVNRFEEKAAFAVATDLAENPTPDVDAKHAIGKDDVIDLSSKLNEDGSLDWTPPAGDWVVLRLGYSLTGQQNRPASPEATGLEVDKLNAEYVTAYFNNYLGQYKDATGGLIGERGLQYLITDSWEAGVQNWTDQMITEFSNRRGYDMLPWLPVLTGYIVESAEASDRFLWDFRRTIADLTVENHYDRLSALLEEWKMGRYTESHESGRAFIADGMEVKRNADIPMSATWIPGGYHGTGSEDVATRYKADVRESASVSHIYGQNLVAAESMTARGNAWGYSPESLKPTADMEFATGVNHFVIHTSVHQPVDNKIPGLGLGPFGQWFTRHETWAEQAASWISYLARSSYMLQQGNFVADIVYFYGEDNNITALFGEKLPDIPEGYNYDFVNADALVNILSVKDGRINTPGGTSYRVMVLDSNSRQMSLPVLRKISEMVESGAVIAGPRPVRTPSLKDDQAEFDALVEKVFGEGEGETVFGKGKIYTGRSLAEVLSDMKVLPDFEYTKPLAGTRLLFVHRSMPGAEIYWINNRNDREENLEAVFRVDGKAAEIWHPETGSMEPASYRIRDGRTTVQVHMGPNDAVFVVFRKKAGSLSFDVPAKVETQVATINGPWELSFQPDRGAPANLTFDTLASWSDHADSGVKYFSGTVSYQTTFQSPDNWFQPKVQLWIDLGDVKNLAEVVVNDMPLGILWHEPFRLEVTGALKAGENKLEVKVTNLWVNRLIGDQQPGATARYTYTTQPFYTANSPLLKSGLLGPVQVIRISE